MSARPSAPAWQETRGSTLGAPRVAMPMTVDRAAGEHVASTTPADRSARMEKGALGANLVGIRSGLHVVETLARALLGIGHRVEVGAHRTSAGTPTGSGAGGLTLLTASPQRYKKRPGHRNPQTSAQDVATRNLLC